MICLYSQCPKYTNKSLCEPQQISYHTSKSLIYCNLDNKLPILPNTELCAINRNGAMKKLASKRN